MICRYVERIRAGEHGTMRHAAWKARAEACRIQSAVKLLETHAKHWSSHLATDPKETTLQYWWTPPLARRHRTSIILLCGILGVLVAWWVRETWTTARNQTSGEPPARLGTANTQVRPTTSRAQQSFARADILATLPSGSVARATFTGKDVDQITRLFPGVGTGGEDRFFAVAVHYPTEIMLTRTDGSPVFVVITNGTWWDNTGIQSYTFGVSESAQLMNLLPAEFHEATTSRTE